MPKIKYQDIDFSPQKEQIIVRANQIIEKYYAMGYDLTLRQLYYQFVAHDYFPDDWRYTMVGNKKWVKDPNGTKNAQPNYDALGDILGNARLAGLVDWERIVDRTRKLSTYKHYAKPSEVIKDSIDTFAMDYWADQEHYVEVWVEKDALREVIGRASAGRDVPYFACRGYTSISAMWEASQRILKRRLAGKDVHIIHLGDHDPSGIDMSRDIKDRLDMFCGTPIHVLRIALNMSQVRKYNPPPDPAKLSDSRAKSYIAKYGQYSWELDSLDPMILHDLIHRATDQYIDKEKWDKIAKLEKGGRLRLKQLYDNFGDVVTYLNAKGKK